MSKETIAAIISDRTIINEQGLVRNAEEVAQAIIDAMGPADIGAAIEAAPGQIAGVNCNYPVRSLTDEDLDRQGKAALFDITMGLLCRLRERWEYQPRQPSLSDADFIVERVLEVEEDQLLVAKQHLRRTQMRDSQASSGNWLQQYLSDAVTRCCFESSCTTCGGIPHFRLGLTARIAEIVGTTGRIGQVDGAELLVELMRELKPPEHPSWKWEKATQLMISDCWSVLGKPIVQDRLGQSWAGLVAERMIADEEARSGRL
jgi:hypothetical protein